MKLFTIEPSRFGISYLIKYLGKWVATRFDEQQAKSDVLFMNFTPTEVRRINEVYGEVYGDE